MLVPLDQARSGQAKRFHRRRRVAGRNRQHPARRACDAVGGIVSMVRADSSRLDVSPVVRSLPPFDQRRKGKRGLRGDEQSHRCPQECG